MVLFYLTSEATNQWCLTITCILKLKRLFIFLTEFEKICDKTAKKVVEPYVDDPMLIGYCMSDCPIFTDNDIKFTGGSTSWSGILRNLGPDAPGKQAYVTAMQARYPNIQDFNASYKTAFVSWNDLSKAVDWRPNSPPANEKEKADHAPSILN